MTVGTHCIDNSSRYTVSDDVRSSAGVWLEYDLVVRYADAGELDALSAGHDCQQDYQPDPTTCDAYEACLTDAGITLPASLEPLPEPGTTLPTESCYSYDF